MTQDWTLETEFANLKPPLNLYKLSQSGVIGYDTYDSCVVVAHSEETAKLIHPSGSGTIYSESHWCKDWCDESQVDLITCELLGTLSPETEYKAGDVICSSFNAG